MPNETYLERLIAERDMLITATRDPIMHGQSYSAGGRTYTLVQWKDMIERLEYIEQKIARMQATCGSSPLYYGLKGVRFD